MYKQATELMLNFKDRILIKGEEDTGKSTLLTEIRISDSDSRYYNFKTLNSAGYNQLCDENIDDFDFLNTPEKTLILDGVRLCEKKMTSKELNRPENIINAWLWLQTHVSLSLSNCCLMVLLHCPSILTEKGAAMFIRHQGVVIQIIFMLGKCVNKNRGGCNE